MGRFLKTSARRYRSLELTDSRSRQLRDLCRWIADRQGRVILRQQGRPNAVLLTYGEYQYLEKLRTLDLKRQLLTRLDTLQRR